MTEEELLLGITLALTLGGWTWMHIIRSDGVTAGQAGFPDIIAAHDAVPFGLAWELKSATGSLTPDQLRWQVALRSVRWLDTRTIRPAQYDEALEVIIHKRYPDDVWAA